MEISTVNGPMAGQRPSAPPPQAGGKGGPSFEDVLQSKDADKDSSLSIDEIGISEEAFAAADLNMDGIIDESEFESGGDRIIGEDLYAQMSEGMQSQMGSPPPLSGQGNSMYGQYGTEHSKGIDLIA